MKNIFYVLTCLMAPAFAMDPKIPAANSPTTDPGQVTPSGYAVASDVNGRYACVKGANGMLVVYDRTTNAAMCAPVPGTDASFSPNGELLLITDGHLIKLYTTNPMEIIASIRGESATFTLDGQHLWVNVSTDASGACTTQMYTIDRTKDGSRWRATLEYTRVDRLSDSFSGWAWSSRMTHVSPAP